MCDKGLHLNDSFGTLLDSSKLFGNRTWCSHQVGRASSMARACPMPYAMKGSKFSGMDREQDLQKAIKAFHVSTQISFRTNIWPHYAFRYFDAFVAHVFLFVRGPPIFFPPAPFSALGWTVFILVSVQMCIDYPCVHSAEKLCPLNRLQTQPYTTK